MNKTITLSILRAIVLNNVYEKYPLQLESKTQFLPCYWLYPILVSNGIYRSTKTSKRLRQKNAFLNLKMNYCRPVDPNFIVVNLIVWYHQKYEYIYKGCPEVASNSWRWHVHRSSSRTALLISSPPPWETLHHPMIQHGRLDPITSAVCCTVDCTACITPQALWQRSLAC